MCYWDNIWQLARNYIKEPHDRDICTLKLRVKTFFSEELAARAGTDE